MLHFSRFAPLATLLSLEACLQSADWILRESQIFEYHESGLGITTADLNGTLR